MADKLRTPSFERERQIELGLKGRPMDDVDEIEREVEPGAEPILALERPA